MPKIHINWEDDDALEDAEYPQIERIQRQPKKEEQLIPSGSHKKKSHRNPEVARRKEYSEEDE